MPDDRDPGGYTINDRVLRLELRTADNTHELEQLRTSLDAYVLKLSSRPSWTVVYVLAFMQAVIGILATALVYVASR